MKTSDILIGAAVVAVGYVVWRSMRAPTNGTTAQAPTTQNRDGWAAIVGGAAGALATVGAERFGEAVRGEREWW